MDVVDAQALGDGEHERGHEHDGGQPSRATSDGTTTEARTVWPASSFRPDSWSSSATPTMLQESREHAKAYGMTSRWPRIQVASLRRKVLVRTPAQPFRRSRPVAATQVTTGTVVIATPARTKFSLIGCPWRPAGRQRPECRRRTTARADPGCFPAWACRVGACGT